MHEVGKRKTQRVKCQHLRLRTRIKRLARKTICFSKSESYARFSNWVVHQSLRVWKTDSLSSAGSGHDLEVKQIVCGLDAAGTNGNVSLARTGHRCKTQEVIFGNPRTF